MNSQSSTVTKITCLLTFACVCVLTGCIPGEQTGVKGPLPPEVFQVRAVEAAPTERTEQMFFGAVTPAEVLHVNKQVLLDGSSVMHVTAKMDTVNNRPAVLVRLTDNGNTIFAQVTREHIDKKLAIIVRGNIILAPVVSAEKGEKRIQITICDGIIQITGGMKTMNEAQRLVRFLTDRL